MTSSYGESALVIGSTISGRVRLKALQTEPSLGPVLIFSLGFQLHNKDGTSSENDPTTQYMLTDVDGNVRLGTEQGPFLAALMFANARSAVRSSHYGNEGDVRMTCEIDWHRLESLERIRAGGPLELWLSLWPRLELAGVHVPDATISPFGCQVPIESWLPVLEAMRGDRTEILEVRIPTIAAGEFEGAMSSLVEARRHVDTGEYAVAIVQCRKAAEMIATIARATDREADSLNAILEPLVGDVRAGAYSNVLAAVKRLGNIELHTVVEHGYRRAEALFAIRTLESLLDLFGAILAGGRA